MRISKSLVLAASVLAPALAQAAEGDQIVVTATRAEKPLSQIGQSITIISQDEITARQRVTVVDLLRTVPGVTFTRNGGVGAATSVYIRGAESEQTVALIDGVKLNAPSTPGSGFNFGEFGRGLCMASECQEVEISVDFVVVIEKKAVHAETQTD